MLWSHRMCVCGVWVGATVTDRMTISQQWNEWEKRRESYDRKTQHACEINQQMKIHFSVGENSPTRGLKPTIYSLSLLLCLLLRFVSFKPLGTRFTFDKQTNDTQKNAQKWWNFRFATRRTNEMQNNFVRFSNDNDRFLLHRERQQHANCYFSVCYRPFCVARSQIRHRQRKIRINLNPTHTKGKFHLNFWPFFT